MAKSILISGRIAASPMGYGGNSWAFLQYILGFRRLGFDVTVFASVHLSSQADADLRAFEDFVRAEPLVRECWMLSGEVDFILKCVAPDMATFQDFVTHLTAAPHVRNVRTSLVLHNSKYEPAVPLDVKVAG